MRRPEGRATRPPERPQPIVTDGDEEEDDEPLDVSETAVTLEDYRVARPAPEPPPISSASRRIRERRARSQTGRSGPSHMDLAAQNYGHIRGDLIRIAIIAVVMFGIIIALSFVVK